MAPFQVFSQGGILPPSRAGAPRSRLSHLALPGGVQATSSVEDPTLRLATLALLSGDGSHASSLVLGAVMSCPLSDEEEDCFHLFFTSLMVQEAWWAAGFAGLVATSDEAFWSSLINGSFRREMD